MVLFIARQSTTVGRVGRILIGLGLMLLALRLVTQSASVLTQAPAVKALLGSLSSDLLLEITVGAILAVLSYSSLAIVLLTATLATTNVIPIDVAIGLGRPLLVTGDPGVGKSSLAFAIAETLGLPRAYRFVTRSTSEARDLFYHYDALLAPGGRTQGRGG